MDFDARIGEARENHARHTRESELASERAGQREKERHETRRKFKKNWENVTKAIIKSGIKPDFRVPTPLGIARANEVTQRRPKPHLQDPILNVAGTYPRRVGVSRKVTDEWDRAILDAIGSSVQLVWDMESYMEPTSWNRLQHRHSLTGEESNRLFLSQDATIYRSNAFFPYSYSESKSGYNYYPINTYMKLNDDVVSSLEMSLAHMAYRKDLELPKPTAEIQ